MSIDRTSPLKPVSTVQTRETSDTPVQKRVRKNVRRDERQRNVKRRASEAHAASVSDINMERVEALKTAIRNGELKMDTGK